MRILNKKNNMEAEDLLDKFAQDEGFGNWETVVLNCHHSVIRSVAIAAVNQALRQPHVVGRSEQFICYKADIGNSRCSSQCRECGENECINK